MNLPLHIALAAGALVWGAMLTTSHAYSAESDAPRFTRLSSPGERSVLKARPVRVPVQANLDGPRSTAHAKAVQAEFNRLCTFKPVMTDEEMLGCRQAFKL
jgi:hypothetical protein